MIKRIEGNKSRVVVMDEARLVDILSDGVHMQDTVDKARVYAQANHGGASFMTHFFALTHMLVRSNDYDRFKKEQQAITGVCDG